MKITCISDTHCRLADVVVPDSKMVIHAGDALSRGTLSELIGFLDNFQNLPHTYKVYVPGNHDMISESNEALVKEECSKRNIIYLNNSGITIEGINLWGSGITPRFHNWAWNRDSGDSGTSYDSEDSRYQSIKPYWDAIPENTDILITHGPPKGILDVSVYDGKTCGCKLLIDRIEEVKPSYHIFGHIHFYGGRSETWDETTYINASVCTEQYEPLNEIISFEYEK